jgi:serine/threonine-protein kinase
MHLGEVTPPSIRTELEKVLSSRGFGRNDRLTKFLRFVVERQLEGKADELKESLVGIEVFGRKPGYDPRQDSVVRTEAAKLRTRLSQYYSAEGAADPIVIELPKGGYVPMFRQREEADKQTTPALDGVRSWFRTRLWLKVALAAIAVVLAVNGWRWSRYKNAPIAIAVLPLNNLSQDSSSDYFADGLTDELIRNLSLIDGLAPRSRTSSFVFKSHPRNVRDVGKQLGVEYILEGSVLRSGPQLRINVQFVRVRDDFPLWVGRYDRELTDVFAIQEEISRGIVNRLRLQLGRGRRRYETSLEAYDLYLRACAFVSNPPPGGGQGRGVELFEEVIAKDPAFAPGYAGLAALRATRSGHFRADHADEAARMRAAAEKAIQLDPLLPEAHDALGMVHARDALWKQSEKSFRHAIELDPSRSLSHEHFAAFLLLPLGRIEEALREMRAAEKTDPLSPSVHYWLVYVLLSAGRYEEAAGHCEKVVQDRKSQCWGRSLAGRGKIDEAIRILEADLPPDRGVVGEAPSVEAWGALGYAHARAGHLAEAEKLASAWHGDPLFQAMIFAGLGDKERTLEALDRGAVAGAFRVGRALTFPELALIRGDSRVKALRKNVGLPE